MLRGKIEDRGLHLGPDEVAHALVVRGEALAYRLRLLVFGLLLLLRRGPLLFAAALLRRRPMLKGSISSLSLISQPNDQTLKGSFSSVSTPNFARNYSLESS